MKNKVKKIFNNKIFTFILGGIVFSSISVMAATYFESNAVTYDNTESGLTSTNVQGAIDELYNTCSSFATTKNYIYYSKNDNRDDSTGYEPYNSSIYRCDSNFGNCTALLSHNGSRDYSYTINDIHITQDNMYYANNEYHSSSTGYEPYSSAIYKCGLNGKNCNPIVRYTPSTYSATLIDNVYIIEENMYYSYTNYNSESTGYEPRSSGIFRCNLDGKGCTTIVNYTSSSSIGDITQ